MTHGSLVTSSASSLAEIRTSVMAASPVLCCDPAVWSKTSHVCQHLAQLLGGGRDDGDEIGFSEPALGAVAPQVTASAAVEHGRVRSRHARFACAQPKGDNLAPITFVFVVGIARQRHRFRFKLSKQFLEIDRLLRQIPIYVAK